MSVSTLSDVINHRHSYGGEAVIGLDVHTGLPKLAVELLPEMEVALNGKIDDLPRKKLVTFDPSAKKMSDEKSSKKAVSPRTAHKDIPHASSLEEKKSPKRKPQLFKNRSRSVFIRLQVPHPLKTPPLHRHSFNVSGEPEPSTDTEIQTCPILPEGKGFNFDSCSQRRSSDSGALNAGPSTESLDDTGSDISHHTSNAGDIPHHTSNAGDVPHHASNAGRRTSFLYLSDDEEANHTQLSRTSSFGSHAGADEYITPFAQILSRLHHVRSQFITLVGLPDGVKTTYAHSHSHAQTSAPPVKISEEGQKKMAHEALEELDWCLRKLETVDSAKSMGTMAQDKFRRILSRELSHMSENSRSGHSVAKWVENMTNWDYGGDAVDRALEGTLKLPTLDEVEAVPTQSLGHDEWRRLKQRSNSRSVNRPGLPAVKVQDYCERVPMFGVSSPNINTKELKEFVETQLDIWNMDTFHLHKLSDGNPLVTAAYTVFKKRNLISEFKISPPTFINFMTAVQKSYKPNPYHNCTHAADVLLATHYLLKAKALEHVFTSLEIMAALVAAAVHDAAHPGRNNQFMVNSGHELALLYNDNSVLENHHLAVAFKIMQDPTCNFLQHIECTQRQAFRRMIIDMVLATDMARHFKHLGELKTLLETKKVANDGILVLEKYHDRSEVLQCLIHCADLSNPSRPVKQAAEWSKRITEELFLQGDEEKRLNIPVSPLGDREHVCIEKCQMTFIDFLIYPLWETWAELVYPDAQEILQNLSDTREYWKSQIPCSPSPSSCESSDDNDATPTERTHRSSRDESKLIETQNLISALTTQATDSSALQRGASQDADTRRSSYASIKDTVMGKEVDPTLDESPR